MSAPKTREPKGEPNYFGIDHWEGGGKGMKERLAPFIRPGVRCFLEVRKRDAELYNAGGAVLATASSNPTTYLELMEWLHGVGVKIVPLDRESITRFLWKRKLLNPGYARTYVQDLLRERGWRHTILAEAAPGDLVVMHPVHLRRYQRRFHVPPSHCIFVDKIPKAWRIWLSRKMDRRVLKKRARFKAARLARFRESQSKLKRVRPHG